HGQCDHCAIMRGENQPPVREEQGGVRVTVVAQGIGASPDIAPGGAGAHVGGEVLQLIAEGAHPAERETACELCREVLRHVDALQLFPQCVVEGGVPVFTRSVIGGLGTGAVPRDAVGHRETGTLGRVGAIVSWGNSLVNSTVNGAVSGGAGGRESEKRPRPIALELGAGIQKNGIRSLSALVAAKLSECRIRGPAEKPLARGNAATSGNREDPPAQRQRSGLHARIRGGSGSVADPRVVQVLP